MSSTRGTDVCTVAVLCAGAAFDGVDYRHSRRNRTYGDDALRRFLILASCRDAHLITGCHLRDVWTRVIRSLYLPPQQIVIITCSS